MGKLFNTTLIFTGLCGGFTYLNHLDTKTEFPDKKIEINLSEIARKTKSTRDTLTNLTSPLWKKDNLISKEYQTQIQEPQETTIQEQNQLSQQDNYPQSFQRHHRLNNSGF